MTEFSEEFKAKLHTAMQSYDGRFALGHVTNGNFYAVLGVIMQEATKELTTGAREGGCVPWTSNTRSGQRLAGTRCILAERTSARSDCA